MSVFYLFDRPGKILDSGKNIAQCVATQRLSNDKGEYLKQYVQWSCRTHAFIRNYINSYLILEKWKIKSSSKEEIFITSMWQGTSLWTQWMECSSPNSQLAWWETEKSLTLSRIYSAVHKNSYIISTVLIRNQKHSTVLKKIIPTKAIPSFMDAKHSVSDEFQYKFKVPCPQKRELPAASFQTN